jgi:hypothetical protein
MWADELFDPDYYDPEVKVPTSSRRTKKFAMEMKKKPQFFHQPINTYSKNIMNAVTGQEYPFRIGSNDERRFYVVMEQDPMNYKEARRLFFDSPQQYESATGIHVSLDSRQRFYDNKATFL